MQLKTVLTWRFILFPPEIGGEAVPDHPVGHSEDVPDPRGGVRLLLGPLHHPRDLVWLLANKY